MSEQNLKNHSRFIFSYHYAVPTAIVAILIGSIINLVKSAPGNLYSASLLILVDLVLVALWWYSRVFALRAQDRAIRAEENFRHFILTGKPLNKSLRMGQIIALRFASDEEFPGLAGKAVSENLSNRQIKELIRNWKADDYRV